jgi:sigma-E factor negative regulatory protein RseA
MIDESIDEQVSALMDGELERESARFLLRRLEHEPELAARFGRYHVIRACLRRELSLGRPGDFAAGVQARLQRDATADAPHAARPARRWLRAAAGGILAAGVAAVALIAVTPHGARGPAVAAAPVAATPAALRPIVVAQPVAGNYSRELAPIAPAEAAIEAYLVRHTGAVANVGGGIAPFAYATALPYGDTVDPNIRRVAVPVEGTR